MNSNLTLLTLLAIAAGGFTILLWAYWGLVLPSIRRQLNFRVERALDRLKILGLGGEVPSGSRPYMNILRFLEDCLEATTRDGWVRFVKVSKDEMKDRKIRLKALWSEMDDASPELRTLVDEGMHSMVSLYVGQRPFVVCIILPLKGLAYFVQRYRGIVEEKEVTFAASSLSGGGLCA